MTSLSIEILLAASFILLIVTAVQRRQIQTLHRRRHLQVQIEHDQKSNQFALLKNFPEPLVIINQAGQVLFRSPKWEALPEPYRALVTLQQLDKLLGTQLTERLRERPTAARFELHLRIRNPTTKTLERVPYFALSWPVHSEEVVLGRAIILFPQHLSKQRQQRYPLLEQQLIDQLLTGSRSILKLSQSSEKLTDQGRKVNLEQIERDSSAMLELATFIKSVHTPLRQLHKHEAIPLAKQVKEVTGSLRSTFQTQGVQIIQTIPTSLRVSAHSEDLTLLIRLLLEHIVASSKRNTTLRIDARQGGGQVSVALTYQHHAEPSEPMQALHLTLIEQLAIKMSGTVSVLTHADHQRIYELELPAAKD